MNKNFHQPVLLSEVLEFLQVKPAEKYIDATIGGGGYSREILKRGGLVLGIDWDQDAINFLKKDFNLEIEENKLILARENFTEIRSLCQKHNFMNGAGIIFDLGVSKHQLDTASRGFSFQKFGPLDMRMNQNLQVAAKDLLSALSKAELTRLFAKFGEEKAFKIASEVVKVRKKKPIETTLQLANLVREITKSFGKIDPATKVFLALRAAVNFELENLKTALPQAFSVLGKSGRLLIISFHSAEDAIVKEFFGKTLNLAILTPKPIRPQIEEILANPASRSARLRVGEKL